MGKPTSTERMRKLRKKLKDEMDSTATDVYKASERKRIEKLREKQRVEEAKIQSSLKEKFKKKREQRAKNKNNDRKSSAVTQEIKGLA